MARAPGGWRLSVVSWVMMTTGVGSSAWLGLPGAWRQARSRASARSFRSICPAAAMRVAMAAKTRAGPRPRAGCNSRPVRIAARAQAARARRPVCQTRAGSGRARYRRCRRRRMTPSAAPPRRDRQHESPTKSPSTATQFSTPSTWRWRCGSAAWSDGRAARCRSRSSGRRRAA